MALRYHGESPKKSRPGDVLLVIHDFEARSPDELSLSKGDRIELIETDQDFGDGWYLGKHLQDGRTGLFPEVYTTTAPRPNLYSSSRAATSPISTKVSVDHILSAEPLRTTASETTPTASSQAYRAPNTSPVPSQDVQSRDGLDNSSFYHHAPSSFSTSQNNYRVASMPNTAYASQPMTGNMPSQRSVSMMANQNRTQTQGSHVMNETMTVIDEHITNMGTPHSSVLGNDTRFANDSGSEYSNRDPRSSYINGSETDEEERNAFSEEEVIQWTAEQVAKYLGEAGVERHHCEVFIEQEITGEVLLNMDQSAVFMKELDLGVVGRRLRTWHKIRAFQEEVRSLNAPLSSRNGDFYGETGSYGDPDRSTSLSSTSGSKLPKIPSHFEDLSRTTSQTRTNGAATPRHYPTNNLSGTTYLPGLSEGHSSSAPVSAQLPPSPFSTGILTPTDSEYQASSTATDTTHRRQSSYDPNWSMPTAAASSSSRATVVREAPISETQAPVPLQDPPQSDRTIGTITSTQPESDQGYTSGGELDNRKTRNVLRKKDPVSPTSHARHSSYKEESNTSGLAVNKRHSRFGSAGSIRGALASVTSGVKGHGRSASAKEEGTTRIGEESPKGTGAPIVTKLDYPISPTKSNRSSSLKSDSPLGGKDFFNSMIRFHSVSQPGNSTLSEKSPTVSPTSRTVETADSLRTITSSASRTSETLADSERPSIVSPTTTSSPTKDTSNQAQSQELSTAVADGEKSLQLGDTNASTKEADLSAFSLAPVSIARGGKNKKKTSAFLRGLRQVTPQEAMQGCDYSGWMKKKSPGIMTIWKPRLFVLQGRRLAYYYSENDTEEKGLIDISSHRVLRADNEVLTGIHATVTGAKSSPISPQNAQTPTMNSLAAAAMVDSATKASEPDGMFIFKLVPPRTGLSRAVQFTKPTVHYFAVDNIKQGRLWMAALIKATIDRDDSAPVVMTTQQKTISLAKARAMRQRPPALMNLDEKTEPAMSEDVDEETTTVIGDEKGLNIDGLNLTPEEYRQALQAEKSIYGEQNPARVPLPADGDEDDLKVSRPPTREGQKAAVETTEIAG